MVFSLFLGHESLHGFRVDGLASVPVILDVVDVKRVIFNSVRWGFEKVFVLIGVLFCSTFLIEKLFILRVISMIILTLRHIRSIVPWSYMSTLWHISPIEEKKIIMIRYRLWNGE